MSAVRSSREPSEPRSLFESVDAFAPSEHRVSLFTAQMPGHLSKSRHVMLRFSIHPCKYQRFLSERNVERLGARLELA